MSPSMTFWSCKFWIEDAMISWSPWPWASSNWTLRHALALLGHSSPTSSSWSWRKRRVALRWKLLRFWLSNFLDNSEITNRHLPKFRISWHRTRNFRVFTVGRMNTGVLRNMRRRSSLNRTRDSITCQYSIGWLPNSRILTAAKYEISLLISIFIN